MSLERIISRLIGQAGPGEEAASPLPPAESRALSRRLRAIVEGEAGEGGSKLADRGPAAEALKLAAYLDGSMSAADRDAFEAELTQSPARRDDLIAAAAWIDEIAARPTTPPADVTALAIALESAAPAPSVKRGAGFAGLVEWLLPRPRLAIATSALASIAIVAVGIDIAFHANPQFRQAIQSPSSPPSGPAIGLPGNNARDIASRLPPADANPDQPLPPPVRLGDPIILTAETINALIAYRNDPTAARQKALLTALARAGSAPIPADQVRAIMLQPQLYERLTQPRDGLPRFISARFSVGGELIIAEAN
ncbi:MAG: hypothetical protein K2Y71_19900 [Xanthobacteraceae bacterium]|nr:hypothetical protein [Xanthobacteraceae bacterium]